MGFNIILSSTSRYSFGLFPSGVSTTDLYPFLFLHTCHTLRPSHPPFCLPQQCLTQLQVQRVDICRSFYCSPRRSCDGVAPCMWHNLHNLHQELAGRLFNFQKYGNLLYIVQLLDPLSELCEETHDTTPLTLPLPQTAFPSFPYQIQLPRDAQVPQTHCCLYCLSSNVVKCSVHLILLYFMPIINMAKGRMPFTVSIYML
jgi:hypothetical protein